MNNWIKTTLLALSTLGIISCGGGDDVAPGKQYHCILNTEHLSKYGTCLQLTKLDIDAGLPAYTREKRLLGFEYDSNDFVGDVEEFTYTWSYHTDMDNREVTLHSPSNHELYGEWFISSEVTGTIDVTLTVKDKDAVLDSMTETLTIIKRPSPILKVQTNDLSMEAYGQAILSFRGSGNTEEVATHMTSIGEKIYVPLHLKAEIIDADEDAVSIGIQRELDVAQDGYDMIGDANITFPLQNGQYTIKVMMEDAHGGVVDKSVTINAPIRSDTFLIDANVSAVIYGSSTDMLFVLTPDSLKLYSLNGTPTIQQIYTGFEGAGSLNLSPDGEKLVVLDRNGTYLFDSNDITQEKYHQIARGRTATYYSSEREVIEIKSNMTVAVTDNNQTFFFAENNSSSVVIYQMNMEDGNLSCFSSAYAAVDSDAYEQTHLHIMDNNALIKTGTFFGAKFNFSENYTALLNIEDYWHGIGDDSESCDYNYLSNNYTIEGIYNAAFIGNIFYGLEGCAWDFSAINSGDYIYGERYLSHAKDYYTSIMSSDGYVHGSAILNSTYEEGINRFILSYDVNTKNLDTPLRMTKLHQRSQSWDYDLFYAFENRAGKKVGVGRLVNPHDLNSTYVLTIEK